MPSQSTSEVQQLLQRVFDKPVQTGGAFMAAGMAFSELVLLYDLVRLARGTTALEIGMANGTSSIVIGEALSSLGGGRLTSIDPFQSADYQNRGIENLRRAGYDHQHELIEQPNYIALPDLVRDGRRFDFIFIDGWHSFDYVIVDAFYADMLLKDGGVLAFHDTDAAPVYKAVHFFSTHKPYERLSPPPALALSSIPRKVGRRLGHVLGGPSAMKQARARRTEWRTLSAFRKMRSQMTPERMVAQF